MADSNELILIVDDDLATAGLQARALEREGYRTATARSAELAVRLLRQEEVRLVLLDLHLGTEGGGLGLYERMKREGLDPPVILVTGEGDQAAAVAALRAGVRDFVVRSADYLDYLPVLAARVLRQVGTEHRLLESQALLSGVIDSAKDAIITVETSQRITLFNPAAEKMFGCKAADAIGKHIFLFVSGDEEDSGDPAETLDLENSNQTLTHRLLRPKVGYRADGSEFPLEASVSRCKVRGRKFYTMVLRDITERKRAEEQIREQAALLDRANDAILLIDLADDRIRFWNKGAERLYGYSAEEAAGRASLEVLGMEPGGGLGQALREVRERGEWQGELAQRTRSGRSLVVASRWTLLRDAQGNPRSKLVINTDVTEKKQAEAELLRGQRIESIGRLAGGIAHDLNNVLTPIVMAIEILRHHVTDPSGRQVLANLKTNAERGAAMVKQVLSFARGVEGQRAPLQVRHLVRELEKTVLGTFPKSIAVRTSLPKDLPLIYGDATQIYQVLMNLCVNSLDAMPDGGELRIAAEEVPVDESFAAMRPGARPGRYVCLSVSDTGAGIPPEIQDKIFDPFFTTKQPGKGTGLGLSTVMGIVQGHKGFVSFTSAPQRGTKFQVYLPVAGPGGAEGSSLAERTLPAGSGQLVLVVDDEPSIREIVSMTLGTHGYRVLPACDGTEALAQFAQKHAEIAAVIIDMMMPVLSGPATVRALQKIRPDVRVIAMSGLADPGSNGLAPHAWLRKPFTAFDLLTTLAEVLAAPASEPPPAAERPAAATPPEPHWSELA